MTFHHGDRCNRCMKGLCWDDAFGPQLYEAVINSTLLKKKTIFICSAKTDPLFSFDSFSLSQVTSNSCCDIFFRIVFAVLYILDKTLSRLPAGWAIQLPQNFQGRTKCPKKKGPPSARGPQFDNSCIRDTSVWGLPSFCSLSFWN